MPTIGVPSSPDTTLLATGQDLLAHLLRRSREILPGDQAPDTADWLFEAQVYVNEAYLWACALQPFRWVRKRTQFVSVASDTVNVLSTSGATITLDAPLTPSRAGRKFMNDSDGIPHRIQAHTDNTAVLTLATVYTGVTLTGSGTIFQDEITVASDILAFPSVRPMHRLGRVVVVSEREFEVIEPVNRISAYQVDRYATFLDMATIRIAPWTSDVELFECSYNYRPALLDFSGDATTDTPVLPAEHRPIIAWRALEKLLRDKRQYDQADQIRDNEVAEKRRTMESTHTTLQKPRSYVPRGYRIAGT